MSNNTVSASATALPSRRLFLASGPAAALVCGVGAAHAGICDELWSLIDAHRAACDAFCEAIDIEQQTKQAYEAAYPDRILIPSFTGQFHELSYGREYCENSIAEQYQRQRQMLGGLARLEPKIAEQARAAIDLKEKAAFAEMERIVAEEEARQEEFGLGAAKRKWQETNDAERAAAIALLSYRCKTIEETRVKVEYVNSSSLVDEIHEPKLMQAFIGSFLG